MNSGSIPQTTITKKKKGCGEFPPSPVLKWRRHLQNSLVIISFPGEERKGEEKSLGREKEGGEEKRKNV